MSQIRAREGGRGEGKFCTKGEDKRIDGRPV